MFKFGAIRLCILSLFVLTTAACNSELPEEVEGPSPARLRIVHAAPGVGGIDVQRVGMTAPLVSYLNYGGFTQTCVQLPPAVESTLNFRQGGETLASATLTPAAGARYTLVFTGSGTTRRVAVLQDNYAANAGFNGVRIINASSGPGDVYVTAPAGEPTTVTRVHENLGVTALVTADPVFMPTDTAQTRIRLFDVNVTTGTPRVDFTLARLPTSRLASVVLADPAAAGPNASFLVSPC